MFLVQRPTQVAIDRFLQDSRDQPLSYAPIGLTTAATVPAGWDLDEMRVPVGRGRADLRRARVALETWRHFAFDWVELHPAGAIVQPNATVAVLIRHLAFWSLNGARVVYIVDDSSDRFGFAYGTLPNHAEAGEELFEVSLDSASETVMYRIRAVSRPRAALARIGYPIVRRLQARFRRDSASAVRRFVSTR
jgi:uncharacterized protein (UPF0548 family)